MYEDDGMPNLVDLFLEHNASGYVRAVALLGIGVLYDSLPENIFHEAVKCIVDTNPMLQQQALKFMTGKGRACILKDHCM